MSHAFIPFTFHPFDLISISLLILIVFVVLGFMAFMVYVGLTIIRKKR